MAARTAFFEQRNPQAVLKHGVLVRYAWYFAHRAGAATGGRVAFIDGYAGTGRYDDGSAGSPLLLATQAKRAELRDVRLAFVEPNRARRDKLIESLAEAGVAADQVLGDEFEYVALELLDRYRDRAVLAFVDPFGLAVSRETLEAVLQRSSPSQPVDVLYHFSISTVRRMGRAVVEHERTAEANATQLATALGPIGWERSFRTATAAGEPTLAAVEVARRFGAAVCAATGVRSTAIEVRKRPHHLPEYLLILFSRNDRAHLDFADQAGGAHIEWLHHCSVADYEANLRSHDGMIELPGLETLPPERDDIDRRLGEEAVPYLINQLAAVLPEAGSVRAVDEPELMFGDLFGRARITHLRKAVTALHAAGRIQNDGKGDFWFLPITWKA